MPVLRLPSRSATQEKALGAVTFDPFVFGAVRVINLDGAIIETAVAYRAKGMTSGRGDSHGDHSMALSPCGQTINRFDLGGHYYPSEGYVYSPYVLKNRPKLPAIYVVGESVFLGVRTSDGKLWPIEAAVDPEWVGTMRGM